MNNTDNMIHLRVKETYKGVFQIVDQDDRVVSGVRALNLNASYDDMTTFTADICHTMPCGKKMLNRRPIGSSKQ